MEDDTILLIGAIGLGAWALNKSGVFDATRSAADAIGGVGQGISTIGRETGETIAAFTNPIQAISGRVTDAISNVGRSSSKPGFYPGSGSGTIKIAPKQLDKVLRDSGVSTMAQVTRDIKNVNGTLVSPLFVGGSYTPPAAASPISPPSKAPSLPTGSSRSPSSSSSKLITVPRAGGGYRVVGASNIKLR